MHGHGSYLFLEPSDLFRVPKVESLAVQERVREVAREDRHFGFPLFQLATVMHAHLGKRHLFHELRSDVSFRDRSGKVMTGPFPVVVHESFRFVLQEFPRPFLAFLPHFHSRGNVGFFGICFRFLLLQLEMCVMVEFLDFGERTVVCDTAVVRIGNGKLGIRLADRALGLDCGVLPFGYPEIATVLHDHPDLFRFHGNMHLRLYDAPLRLSFLGPFPVSRHPSRETPVYVEYLFLFPSGLFSVVSPFEPI